MHLKKLELSGFKSFAKRTEVFFEKGVTCIVGPNGCGKSNISDSIRWVLGERSAKLLRGSKMEDVIFQGTDSRDPINFAEVTLTIDNSDKALPIEYEEVAITRRLHRSGESEYLINKTACRLKDIQDLILDTGIGSNSYSMIEQGRIDYILSAEAEERRFLIEEAAGISKYKVKKDEAIRKLEQTEQNLLRLNDIVSEVERNIKYAERQAKRAEQYKVFFEKLKHLELVKLAKTLNDIQITGDNLNTQQTELQQRIQDAQARFNEVNRNFLEINEQTKLVESEYFKAEQERIESEQKLFSIQKEKESTRERYHETKATIEANLNELSSIQEKLQKLIHEIAAKKSEFQQLTEDHRRFSETYQQHENKLHQADQELINQTTLCDKLREDTFEMASKLVHLRNELNQLTALRINLASKKEQAVSNIDQHSESASQATSEAERLNSEISQLRNEIDAKQLELETISARKDAAFSELKQNQSELLQAKERKVELIQKLQHLNQVDGVGVQVARAAVQKSGELGDLQAQTVDAFLDVIDITEGYEVAWAVALSDYAKSIVTHELKTALHIVKQIQNDGHPQISVLVRNAAQNAAEIRDLSEYGLTPLLTFVKIKEGFSNLLSAMIGNVYVAESLAYENLQKYLSLPPDIRIVTRGGISIGPNFHVSLRGGSLNPIQDFKAKEKEKTDLSYELKTVQHLIDDKLQAVTNTEAEISELESRLKEANEFRVNLQLNLQKIDSALTALADKKLRFHQQIELSHLERMEVEGDEVKLIEREALLRSQLDLLIQEEARLKDDLSKATELIGKYKFQKDEILMEFARVKTLLENHLRNEQQTQESLTLMESSRNEWDSRVQYLEGEQITLKEKLLRFSDLTSELSTQEQSVQQKLITASSQAEQKRTRRDEYVELKNQAENDRNQIQTESQELQTELYGFEKKKMELEYEKRSALERVQNTYHISVESEQLEEAAREIDATSDIEQEIEGLKKKVEAYGTVNLLAIEEYDELKQRFEFLSNQKKDLDDSKEQLIEAIRKINRTTKQLFEDTLIRVREMFKYYFKLLFEGGDADLVLIDETNPLDSGLDIIARPPGKKPQHITLLSGGEKAMTAIGLLFALFKVKPSPYCVLDEVDAPLDEANNERFVRVVREFLESTQFIIVTHSRKTISMGDTLYGVTMEEAGVSKLVSVKVAQDSGTVQHHDQKIQSELNSVIQ